MLHQAQSPHTRPLPFASLTQTASAASAAASRACELAAWLAGLHPPATAAAAAAAAVAAASMVRIGMAEEITSNVVHELSMFNGETAQCCYDSKTCKAAEC
jgi:hypothetical protein